MTQEKRTQAQQASDPEDYQVVRWLQQNDKSWAKWSFKDAMTRWQRYKAGYSDEAWNYVQSVYNAYRQTQTQQPEPIYKTPEQVAASNVVSDILPSATPQTGKLTPQQAYLQNRQGAQQQYAALGGEAATIPSGLTAYDEVATSDGKSYMLLGIDPQFSDLLTPDALVYYYNNMMLMDSQTGEIKRAQDDPQLWQAVVAQQGWTYNQFAYQAKYQAMTNELIAGGATEEDLQIPEVAAALQKWELGLKAGKGVDYAKEAAWIKAVGENSRQMKQTQEAWKLHQSTPANVWMDKDIIRQMNPQGYQSDEYKWEPLVKKAVAKPQRVTML